MPTLKLTIDCEIDGKRASGFPLSRRAEVDEIQQFNVTRATGGGYVATPTSDLASLKALVIHPDQAVTIRLDAQSDAGLELNAGGVLAIIDCTIDAGASTNATISNASGSDAQIEGVAAG
jgi:predicted methyltransferase